MKIVIDARLYGLEHGGLGRYLINLIRELDAIDKENTYTLILRKKYLNNQELPKSWDKIAVDHRHYSIAEQFEIPRMLKSLNPDLVHFPHFNVPLLYRGKYVVTVHDMLMHKIKGKSATTLPPHKYFIKRMGYKLVFRKAVMGSAKIIVPSHAAKKDIIDYYKIDKNKVAVTYEGLDKNVSPKGNNNKRKSIEKRFNLKAPFFIYVGNAYPHKNLHRLIEATVFLNENSGHRATLAISTPKNIFSLRLKTTITELKADNYVKLLGFVPDEEVALLYSQSVGFVYPSLLEGFGLQGLEAISNDTLVLASDIPVFKEVYKNNVLYFNPFDFSSIESAMKLALEMDASKRKKVISEAQKFIKKYSWTKMAQQTVEVYNSALSK
jgi:glycosyltransferase involved in cell wall biosynthesis